MNRSDEYNNMLAKIFAKSCGISFIYIYIYISGKLNSLVWFRNGFIFKLLKIL